MTTTTVNQSLRTAHYAVTYAAPASEFLPPVVTAHRVLKWVDHESVWVGFILDQPDTAESQTPLVVLRVEADWVVGYTVHDDLVDAMDAAHSHGHSPVRV